MKASILFVKEKEGRRQSKISRGNHHGEWLIMQFRLFRFSPFFNSKKTRYVFLRLTKVFLLFSTGVYLLTLPFYYFNVASPLGIADFLMPFEVIFCLILSLIMFFWFAKTVLEILKAWKTKLLADCLVFIRELSWRVKNE